MELLERILKEENIAWVKDGNGYTIDDVGGDIYIEDGEMYFIHGNQTVGVELTEPDLDNWIRAYINGFDEFEDYMKKKGWGSYGSDCEYYYLH